MRWIALVSVSILFILSTTETTKSVNAQLQQQPEVHQNQIIGSSPDAASIAAAGIDTTAPKEAAVIDDTINNYAPTSADAAAPDDDSSSTHSPAVGLPIGSWSILQLNESSRAATCKQQMGFCANECGGADMTSLNFCNQTTMAWGCNCRNKFPDCPPYQWPVTLAECQGREQKCEAGCSTDNPTKDLCIDGCKAYFRCNRPGGPQSRLQTEQPDIAPVYDTTSSTTSSASSPFILSSSMTAAVTVISLLLLPEYYIVSPPS